MFPLNQASSSRREFLHTTSKLAVGAGVASMLPGVRLLASEPAKKVVTPELMTKVLYDSLSPGQREAVCFAWDHEDGRGLLRTHVSANWDITDKFVASDFFTNDQREMVRLILEGIVQPEWHERIYKQLKDDSGGFGKQNSFAIFGEPGSDKCEFVLTGRHMTLRADGNTTPHVAFGGPIFYGHAAETFDESPKHRGNVFWPQAEAANKLYQMLDGEQQEAALVLNPNMPAEDDVYFEGDAVKEFQGIPVGQLSSDQQEHMQVVLKKLIEPYRTDDQNEVLACLEKHGGLNACHLAFYQEGDLGNDKVWDNWRLEGPAFVWHFRGAPHVHCWVHVADSPEVELNAG
jgi:hypothetical protein